MRKLTRMTAAVLAALGSAAVAQAETVVLKADHYLDVEAGRLVSPANIVVEDERIVAINPKQMPQDYRSVPLPGLTLVPGLMDAHTHLTLDVSGNWRYASVERTAGDLALLGAVNARKTLLAGFTTIRDLGAGHFSDVAIARAIDQGLIDGPHVIPAGHSTGITGGHCDTTGLAPGIVPSGPETGIGDGPDELTKAIRYQVKHGAGVVKICATSGVMSHEATVGAQQTTAEELRAAAEEAHRHGLRIAAHAVGEAGIVAASNAGIDSIEHASELGPNAVAAIRRNGTHVVPTLYLFDAIDPASLPPAMRRKGEKIRDAARTSFQVAVKEKLKVVNGSDAGVFPHGDNAQELATRVRLGQSPIEAIRGATIYASQLLDVPDRGSLKPGLLADIIAVPGDPLADVGQFRDVRFVMKEGRVYKQP